MLKKTGEIVVAILLVSFSITLAIAATQTITPTSQNVVEDVTQFYNISVNITDATRESNITQVNITIPSTFIDFILFMSLILLTV